MVEGNPVDEVAWLDACPILLGQSSQPLMIPLVQTGGNQVMKVFAEIQL
jgi:hypothetical protein